MKVKKDRLRLAVDALRSGEYPQGRGKLRSSDGKYCCLGVLTEVARANGLKLTRADNPPWYCSRYAKTYTATLPASVMRWYGLSEENPTLRDEQEHVTNAITLNDSWGYNFQEIADAFERTYLNED